MIEVAAGKPEIEPTDFEAVFVNNRKLAQVSAHLNRFNPIRVMRMERMEIRHSAILAWLLNPQESHGLSDQFLKAFLGEALRGQSGLGFPSALDVVRTDLRKAQIRREWQNIDILIHLPEEGWAFVVENKFDSKQHSGQLTRYIEKVQALIQHDERELTVRGIFLTLHDEEPADPRYAPINYDMICEILPDVLTREAHSLTVEAKTFPNHYIEILEEELGVSQQRTEMEKLARELYREHKKVLDFVIAHGVNSDFAMAIQSIAGDDPDREEPVTIDGKTYHFNWIGNDVANFLPAQWYDGFGGERYDWEGCEDWGMGYPRAGAPRPFEGSAETALLDRVREMEESGFILPFPQCAFIFHDPQGRGTRVELLEQVNGRIFQTGYHRSFQANEGWSIDAIGFNFDAQLKCGFPTLLEELHQDWEDRCGGFTDRDRAWVRASVNKISVALAMLSMPTTERETISSDLAASVNRGRAKGKLAPIPDSVAVRLDPVTIRLNPMSSGNSHAGTGSASPRCPHDRRAHSRRLRSGRVVSVKATSIHGGGDGTRQYRVVA